VLRSLLSLVLGPLNRWACAEHIPLIGTTPLTCARCWRPLGYQPSNIYDD